MKSVSVIFVLLLLMAGCSGSDNTSAQSETVDVPPGYSTERVTMGNQIGTDPSLVDEGGKRKVDTLNYYFNGNAEIVNGYPNAAVQLIKWCNSATPLNTSTGVIPMIIYYSTIKGSEGDWAGFKVDVNDVNLPKHYIDLGLVASYYSFAISQKQTTAASILINPDLLGYITQQGWLTNPAYLPSLTINVNTALKAAVCVLSSQSFEDSLSLDDLWQKYGNNASGFNDAFTPFLNDCLSNPQTSVTIPTFENNFAGYTLAMNWLVKTYGKSNVTYGWHMNISAPPAGMAWIYNDLNQSNIQSTFTTPVLETLETTSYSDASWMPDFLAFDKYGADDTQVSANGYPYFYNARDWDNYLMAVKQTSEGLGNLPIMLWQIPGGHIQYEGDPFTDAEHISSISTYLFGDVNLQSDLSNTINLSNVVMGNIHHCGTQCDAISYLRMNNYDWSTSNKMAAVIDANIFAIHWMTYTLPTVGIYVDGTIDDKGWLSNKVNAYASLTQ